MPHARHAPWALLPCIVLAVSSVTLLVPRHAARADTPKAALAAASAPHPVMEAEDDGDGGTELLEHWGDPKYSREERLQLAGMPFLLTPLVLWFRRGRAAQHRKAG